MIEKVFNHIIYAKKIPKSLNGKRIWTGSKKDADRFYMLSIRIGHLIGVRYKTGNLAYAEDEMRVLEREKQELANKFGKMSKYNNTYHGEVGEVYYKLIRSPHTELVTVACLQWFDEADYEEERFVRNSENEIHVFADEELAIEKLNEWYEQDQIDEEYRRKSYDNIRD